MASRQSGWALMVAVVVAGGAAMAVLPGAADAEQCDGKATPCPLQKWMRVNAGTPMSSGDLAKLAKTMEQSRKFGGPEMKDWDKMSKQTAEAAAAGKTDDVKAGCKA